MVARDRFASASRVEIGSLIVVSGPGTSRRRTPSTTLQAGKAFPMTSTSGDAPTGVPSPEELQRSLDVAREAADRLQLQYDELLADPGVIQEDRDSVGALLTTAKAAVAAAEAAVSRAADGTYGVCEVCGNPIPPARLEALPEARRCVGCA
ncbi:MAG: TraR/DksA C4-type zinc finger protein [Microthrixaceae bacterium]